MARQLPRVGGAGAAMRTLRVMPSAFAAINPACAPPRHGMQPVLMDGGGATMIPTRWFRLISAAGGSVVRNYSVAGAVMRFLIVICSLSERARPGRRFGVHHPAPNQRTSPHHLAWSRICAAAIMPPEEHQPRASVWRTPSGEKSARGTSPVLSSDNPVTPSGAGGENYRPSLPVCRSCSDIAGLRGLLFVRNSARPLTAAARSSTPNGGAATGGAGSPCPRIADSAKIA